ncbi:hypothetical protein V8B97DRAFT_1918575 [Scleroderma yunnanense]
MIMRIYALYEKSKRVLLFLLVYAMLCIGVGCWAILSPESSGSPIVPNPPLQYGCDTPLTVDQATHFAITWSGQLAFDAIIFIMTLWRSLRIRKRSNRALLDVLIRDVIFFTEDWSLTPWTRQCDVCRTAVMKVSVTSFTNLISVTMISRLMLNLRDPKIAASSRLITPTNLKDGTLLLTTMVSADFTCPSRYVDEPGLELQYISGGRILEVAYATLQVSDVDMKVISQVGKVTKVASAWMQCRGAGTNSSGYAILSIED